LSACPRVDAAEAAGPVVLLVGSVEADASALLAVDASASVVAVSSD